MNDFIQQKLENAFNYKQKTFEQWTKLQDEWFNIYLWVIDSVAKFWIGFNGVTLTIFLTLKEKFIWVVCLWWFLPLWIAFLVSAISAIMMKYFYAKMRFAQAKIIQNEWNKEVYEAKLSLPKELTQDWNGEIWKEQDFELIRKNIIKYTTAIQNLKEKADCFEKICTALLAISVISFFLGLCILIYIGYKLTL